ncbi:MAG TPA: c-type cytochrome [Vicinamibacteria bacterium]|nr:c-type cytochrome [Vicinamibacteria bacterium]
MRKRLPAAVIVGLFVGLAACGPPERSPAGFRLPDGDVEAGEAAFLELRCNACHQVQGLDLPPPVADPPVPVALGGRVDYQPTDGRFVTSIINPDHKFPRGYPEELIKSGSGSRMADYSDVMTVRQLVDLVAFLHSRTEYVRPEPVH